MQKIFKYSLNYGRMGTLEGMFFSTEEEIGKILGKEIYFGDVLGKHSNINVEFERSDFEVVEVTDDFVKTIKELGLVPNGYNPLEYEELEEDYGEN